MADIDELDALLEQSLAKKVRSPNGNTSPTPEPVKEEQEQGEKRRRERSTSASGSPDRKRSRHDNDREGARSSERTDRRGDRDRDDRGRRDRGDRDRDYDRRDRDDRDRRDRGDRDRDDRDRRDRRDRGDRDRDDRDRRGDRDRDSRRRSRDDRDGRRSERDRDSRRSDRDRDNDTYSRKEKAIDVADTRRRAVEALTAEDVGDRDARTVFVTNLPTKADEKDIKQFFEKAGKVRDVRLITDRFSRKSKGFGYIELDSVGAISEAIQLSGTQFMGKTIVVQASQAEKNKTVSTTTATLGPTRLYVGGLHPSITEQDVRDIFAQFGSVEFVTLQKNSEGSSKGFAFVQYKNGECAKRALAQVNGQELLGSALKVGLVHKSTAASGGLSMGMGMGALGLGLGMGGMGRSRREDRHGEGGDIGDFDDDSSISLNSSGRAALMAKLVHENDFMNPQLAKPTVVPSQCLCLKNMFSPNDPDIGLPSFEQDLCAEISEECSQFGMILHVKVDKYDPQGTVYLRFSREDAATRAFGALNGRWFAGQMIEASYVPVPEYVDRFPEAQ